MNTNMNINKLKITSTTVIIIISIAAILFYANLSLGKARPYYSGQAIRFQNKIVFATVNTGEFELFVLDNNKIIKTASISNAYGYDSGNKAFDSQVMKQEADRLYAYLVNGAYLYKYDITDPFSPKLETRVKDNSWDWFTSLSKAGNYIISKGTKGIKAWNSNLDIINAYNIINSGYSDNLRLSETMKYIYNIDGDKLQIYSSEKRDLLKEIKFFLNEEHVRKLYNDEKAGLVYMVDDQALRAYDLGGVLKKEFKHISKLGYDVAALDNSKYLYFSDGVGIVKAKKSDLKPVDWIFTTKLEIENGWAMGLDVAMDKDGEKVFVFNESSILVLDEDLKLVDYYLASGDSSKPIESLYLNYDKKSSSPGEYIALSGGGYGLNEPLQIIFAGTEINATSNKNGKFKEIIKAPSVLPGNVQITVNGVNSGRTYSISFVIN
ncbi:MAG: hypothetical protein WCV70_01010 [Patescibacteria group bacterium]